MDRSEWLRERLRVGEERYDTLVWRRKSLEANQIVSQMQEPASQLAGQH